MGPLTGRTLLISLHDNNIATARSTGKQLKVFQCLSPVLSSAVLFSEVIAGLHEVVLFLEGPLSETPLLATGTTGTW